MMCRVTCNFCLGGITRGKKFFFKKKGKKTTSFYMCKKIPFLFFFSFPNLLPLSLLSLNPNLLLLIAATAKVCILCEY